jgi:hypothetical protein
MVMDFFLCGHYTGFLRKQCSERAKASHERFDAEPRAASSLAAPNYKGITASVDGN